jgi:excisionase family DNA binding protein
MLGVSAETVLRWTRRGELPAVRLPGGAIRYRTDQLEAWLVARAVDRRRPPADTAETTSAPAPLARPGALPQGGRSL